MRNNKSNKGFTLIELLIVIAIIGILAAVLIPNLLGARARAVDTAGQAFHNQVSTAIKMDQIDNGLIADLDATECAAVVAAHDITPSDSIGTVTCTYTAATDTLVTTWQNGQANSMTTP